MATNSYRTWMAGALGAALLAAVASCGGTGGGSGSKGQPDEQFILNSNRSGALILNVNPTEVDANKSDRIGLVATLTDSFGNPIANITILFRSDIPDIRFIPGDVDANGDNFGVATTDVNGNADIIAVAGSSPTGTGAIIGSGAIFAIAPAGFGLVAQQQVTLLDVGFIDDDVFNVIPMMFTLVEPRPGTVVFFNIVGGVPPYLLKNESSGIGTATISQHCGPGCTENGGVLCVGSPCQTDSDCNDPALPPVDDVCVGPVRRCLASCAGSNCAGSRCDTDADCNDGSATPANVCKDSGQSIVYTIGSADVGSTHGFVVEDSAGDFKDVTVTVEFVCGNGVAGGSAEQCDLADVNDGICESFGLDPGCTLTDANDQICATVGIDDGVASCAATCVFACVDAEATPVLTPTPVETSTPLDTPTPTETPTATPTPTATSTPP